MKASPKRIALDCAFTLQGVLRSHMLCKIQDFLFCMWFLHRALIMEEISPLGFTYTPPAAPPPGFCLVSSVWTSSGLLSQLAALPSIPRQTPLETWLELTSKHRWAWVSLQIIHSFTLPRHSLKSEFLTKFKAKKNNHMVSFSTENIPFSFDKHIINQYTQDLGKLHWKQYRWRNHSKINF